MRFLEPFRGTKEKIEHVYHFFAYIYISKRVENLFSGQKVQYQSMECIIIINKTMYKWQIKRLSSNVIKYH